MTMNAFKYRDKYLISSLYKTYIRHQLEFAQPVWSLYLRKDIEKIENVQCRVTKMIDFLRDLDYNERLEQLGLTTLETRRQRGDLIQTFKIIRGFEKVEFNKPIELKSSFKLDGPAGSIRGHRLRIEQ
jgi:ribonuclease P/MRP protein subunit RPP40